MNADDLLRRLVEWNSRWGYEGPVGIVDIIDDARVYLSREKGPVAEGWVQVRQQGGKWVVGWDPDLTVQEILEVADEPNDPLMRVRIPVPAHIVSPPTVEGEVIP